MARFFLKAWNWDRSLPKRLGVVVTLVVAGTWILWALLSGIPMASIATWALGASVLAGMVAAWVCSRALDSVRLALHLLRQLDQQLSFSGPVAEQVSALTHIEGQTDYAHLVKLSSHLLVRYGDRLQFLERQRLALEGWLRDQNTRLALMEAEHEKLKITLFAAQQRIHQLEGIDIETGVANRHRFDEALQQAWQQATRSRQVLSIVACEIDRFADWVSWQGEELGERCIQQLARVLKKQVHRSSDVIGRDQGNRFLILLPNTDSIGALAVAEAVRHQFHQDWLQSELLPASDPSSTPMTTPIATNGANGSNGSNGSNGGEKVPTEGPIDIPLDFPSDDDQAPQSSQPLPSHPRANPPTPSKPSPQDSIDQAPAFRGTDRPAPPKLVDCRMTISLGISTLIPDAQQSPDVAVRSAIRAVARAHRHGGDCVDMDGLDY
ncbi:MAG TPA: GGDEF domain-containing protein [Coleofasciculaceae cyanobacterium]